MFCTSPNTGTSTFLNISNPENRTTIVEELHVSSNLDMMTALAFPGVDESYVLWRAHDHSTIYRNVLRYRELSVASSWRHVDDEVV